MAKLHVGFPPVPPSPVDRSPQENGAPGSDFHQLPNLRRVLPTDSEDKELVRMSMDGDIRSFEQLIDRYQGTLFNLAYRMLRDFDDASDVTQATFIKVYRHLESFDPKHKFFSWIYRIQLNESINLLKRRPVALELPEDLQASEPGPAESYECVQLREQIQGAIAKLSPDYQAVIAMRHYLDLSYDEMAEILGLPQKTVKSRLYSARQRLATLLLKPIGASS